MQPEQTRQGLFDLLERNDLQQLIAQLIRHPKSLEDWEKRSKEDWKEIAGTASEINNAEMMDLSNQNIVNDGLPSLGRGTFSVTQSTSRRKSNYEVEIIVQQSNFGFLEEFKRDKLVIPGSVIWNMANLEPEGTLSWSNESDIQAYVSIGLKECLAAAKLGSNLKILTELALSVASIMVKAGNRVDAIALAKNTFAITGVCQVKLPGFDFSNIAQIVDYMIDLRNYFNVRFVFGILTTYEKWMILWFDDLKDAAEATSKDKYDELCLAGSANDYAITESVKVHKSKIYDHNDPELIECLCSLLYKIALSPVYLPTRFTDQNRGRRYVYMTKDKMVYKQLPTNLKIFKYSMPHNNTTNFYVLAWFHRGGDGRVALLSSEKGHLAVVKFLKEGGDEALAVEKENWKVLWDINCRIVTLNNQNGLLMPFCLTFNNYTNRQKRFSSLGSWNKRWIDVSFKSDGDEMESNINQEMFKSFQNNPEKALAESLEVLESKNRIHNDLEWRHLALLPLWNSATKLFDFKPIFIDLTRVEIGKTLVREETTRMLKLLPAMQ